MKQVIELEIDGVRVVGEAVWSEADLEVCLPTPDGELRDGSHIPTFARRYRSFTTEGRGEQTAASILLNLHHLSRFVQENWVPLRRRWADMKSAAAVPAPPLASESDLGGWRTSSLALVAAGKRTSVDHQRQLTRLKADLERWRLATCDLVMAFARTLPFEVSLELGEQVVGWLERE